MKDVSKTARLTMGENTDQEGVRPFRQCNLRRRLFQDDRDDSTRKRENEEQVLEETRKNKEQSKLKWNFDFDKGIPLPGRYEWVKIDETFDGNPNFVQDSTNIPNPQDIPNSVLRDSTNIPNPQGQTEEEEEESDVRNVTETE